MTVKLTAKDCPKIKDMGFGKEYDFIIHTKYLSKDKFEILSVDCPDDNQMLNEDDFTEKNLKRLQQKSKEY